MEDDFLIVPSGTPDSYCRLCLSETNVEVLLFSDGYPQPKQNLVDLIRRHVAIGLSTPDNSPCGICATCRMMLEEFERFRERCLRCDYALTGIDRQPELMLPFECRQCPCKFRYKTEYEKHWKSFHDLYYRCELCDATFSTQSMLDGHSKFHDGSSELTSGEMFHCSYCPRMFPNDRQLRFHVQMLHEPSEPKPSNLTLRLNAPTSQLGLAEAGQLCIKSEPIDPSQSITDLSGGSTLNMAVASAATDLNHSTRGGDATATEPKDEFDGGDDDDDESEDESFYKLDNRVYQCKFCPEAMPNQLNIQKHIKMQHPSQSRGFKCVHCKRRFTSGLMRDRHAQFHSLNHPFKCSDCDQLYSSKEKLDKHFGIYHETRSPNFSEERFHCVICQLKFVEKKYYSAHSRIYHNRKQKRSKKLSDNIHVCERCVKRFDSENQLSKHIQEAHQGDGRLESAVCHVCSKDMKRRTFLKIHILVEHMGIMPFVCQHCQAGFASRHWLQKHMEKGHSGIALHKCPHCDESFTTEARMIEHRDKLHEQLLAIKSKPKTVKTVYPCGQCDKKLETQERLDEHVKAHLLYVLLYRCPLCLQSVRHREQHMRVHHDIEYDEKQHKYQVRFKCHCCSKLFQQKCNLLAHRNSLANRCGRCSIKFKSKESLLLHLATHRNKPLQCEDCGLDFGYRGRLEEHRQRYHSATSTEVLKIHNCPHCPKLFLSPVNRAVHIAKFHNIKTGLKVHCNHCPMQATSSIQLRQHYRSEHPNKPIAYKCPECEKFYLDVTSFKYHYNKKHKQKKDDAKKNYSEPVKAEEMDQCVDEGLQMFIKVENTQIGGAITEIRDTTLNVESSAAEITIKQEPLSDVQAATSKDLWREQESMVETGPRISKPNLTAKPSDVENLEDEGWKGNKIPRNNAALASRKTGTPKQEQESPAPYDDLRSANNPPTSTLAESSYTSNEASDMSESSGVTENTGDKRRLLTRNAFEKKQKLVVLLEPIDIDKLAEQNRGSWASSSLALDRAAIKSSVGGSSSDSQPNEDGFRAKRLRRDRRTPNSDIFDGDSLIDSTNQLGLARAGQLNIKSEPIMDTSQSIMDLSGGSALNMSVVSSASTTDLHHSTRGVDPTAMELENEIGGGDESEDDTFYKLDNGPYQCKLCPVTTCHLSKIRQHTKMHHPSHWKSFKCAHCKSRFTSGSMRDRHAHFHSLNHPFKCSDCDQMYSSKKRMDEHFAVYHETRSPKFSKERLHCVICHQRFVEKKYYDAHSRIYHNRKPQQSQKLLDKIHVCERCVKRFDSRHQLSEHIREAHHGDGRLKSPVCQVCSKDLKLMPLLRIHILVVHMGILPFVCQHCNAKFASRHWLLKHTEKDHSDITMYRCPCCDESFTTEASMIEHKDKDHQLFNIMFESESRKTVYSCGKCDRKFETQELLDEHLLKVHRSFVLMYRCPLCMNTVRYRKRHMRIHHAVEYDGKEQKYQVRYKCHCCSKLFQQKRKLLAHQNSLANQCGRCSMKFNTKESLSLHLATHSLKRLQCEDCGLEFGYWSRLDEHRRRYHSANSTEVLNTINCPYCPKLFIRPSNRQRHIDKCHSVTSGFNVLCYHCPMQATGSIQLRQHYRSKHPEERIIYKCPECEKFYMHWNTFKDHYKRHKQAEDDKTEMNSTSEALEGGENGKCVGEALKSIMKIEDIQFGEPSADGLNVKQESLSDG